MNNLSVMVISNSCLLYQITNQNCVFKVLIFSTFHSALHFSQFSVSVEFVLSVICKWFVVRTLLNGYFEASTT